MPRILVMEGNPAPLRARADALGVPSSSTVYCAAVRQHFPTLTLDVVNAADPGSWLPAGRQFEDYDGMIVGGSSLHAYDTDFSVTNQIEMLRAACEAGVPVLGSCWGLQVAAIAGGGSVGPSPKGREIGIARKIIRTPAGSAHPFLAGKPAAYDAPCIHYDEVTALPPGAVVLAYNRHSAVQAATIPFGQSEIWGVQYHPEFDLGHVARLLRLYAREMIEQRFFRGEEEQSHYQRSFEALAADANQEALRWQLGIDDDILDDAVRHAEITAWVERITPLRAA